MSAQFDFNFINQKMELEGQRNQNQPAGNGRRNQNERKMTKKSLKMKISSRNDFILMFGLERKITSELFLAPKTFHILAFHHRNFGGPKEIDQAKRYQNKHCSPQNKRFDGQEGVGIPQRRRGSSGLLP